MLGVVPLVWVAHDGRRGLFLALLALLLFTDLVDGPLSRRWGQAGKFGARLDSFADGLLHAGIALSFWWLDQETFRTHLPWFLTVFATWALSVLVALLRLGSMPSYHTWLAKASAVVAGVVALGWILGGWTEGIPWALGLVTVANIEAIAIGLVLPERLTDVGTFVHALEARRRHRPT